MEIEERNLSSIDYFAKLEIERLGEERDDDDCLGDVGLRGKRIMIFADLLAFRETAR